MHSEQQQRDSESDLDGAAPARARRLADDTGRVAGGHHEPAERVEEQARAARSRGCDEDDAHDQRVEVETAGDPGTHPGDHAALLVAVKCGL